MPEHRHWTLTLNYYTETDVQELRKLIYLPMVDYWAYGYEGCERHHPHIHVSIHFKSSKTLNALLSHFSKRHHSKPVVDSVAMHDYIRGYKKSKLKCVGCVKHGEIDKNGKWIPCNKYYTEGSIPENGIKKTPKVDMREKVLEAIQAGKTIKELDQLFPMFMLYHKDKVIRWQRDHTPYKSPKYFFLLYEFDAITEWIESLALEEQPTCVITELSQIELYDDTTHILFLLDSEYSDILKLLRIFGRGMPIYYKKGYEIIKVQCQTFTVACSTNVELGNYKKI